MGGGRGEEEINVEKFFSDWGEGLGGMPAKWSALQKDSVCPNLGQIGLKDDTLSDC